ncbi:MAG: DUF2974 domain-containing protein [Bacillota bacterium]|nr:DUF2974 domain-containing protein [Bacillota bacterium]
MANLFDYIKWRGDLSFDSDPFNEVDNLILCQLSYADFKLLKELDQDFLPLKQVYELYKARMPENPDQKKITPKLIAEKALKDLGQSERYKDIKIGHYKHIVSKDPASQFVAVTYVLDQINYIAYGGSDNTLIAWKDDLYFSYDSGTKSQLLALAYLEEMEKILSGPIDLGGHSKGGNLAMYAGIFADPKTKARLRTIWANDSPGFTHHMEVDQQLMEIKDRICLFVPQSSVIGLLMEQVVKSQIIKADAKLIDQHYLHTWQVLGKSLVREEALSEDAIFIKKAIDSWLAQIPYDQRKEAIDGVFYSLEAARAATFLELQEGGLKSIKQVLKAAKSLPKSQYDLIVDLIGKFLSQSKDLFVENVLESVNQTKQDLQEKIESALADDKKDQLAKDQPNLLSQEKE